MHTTLGELSSQVSGTLRTLLLETRSNLFNNGTSGALVPEEVILKQIGYELMFARIIYLKILKIKLI